MKFSGFKQKKRYIYFRILFLLMPILGHNVSFSKEKTFELEHQIVEVSLPQGWEVVDSLMGQELTFFGPWKGDSRPIISVNAIDTFDGQFSVGQMRRKEQDYRKGRMDFLKRSNAELVKFIPYKQVQWSHLKEVHQIGYRYKHLGEEFVEMNFYYKCDRQLHMTSSLLTATEDAQHRAQVQALLNSLKCSPKKKS